MVKLNIEVGVGMAYGNRLTSMQKANQEDFPNPLH